MSTTTVELAPTEPQYEYFFRDNTFDNRREVLTGDKVVETFSEVPLVDIGGIFSDKYEERLRTAQRVAEVCKTVGFMYITNHGIPQELMDAVFDVSRKYHAQPVEVKKQEYIFNSETLSGYDVHYYQTPEGPKGERLTISSTNPSTIRG
jgi:isopenicillin N synthase-like dioxygenase